MSYLASRVTSSYWFGEQQAEMILVASSWDVDDDTETHLSPPYLADTQPIEIRDTAPSSLSLHLLFQVVT
jgi:hypothetical protein